MQGMCIMDKRLFKREVLKYSVEVDKFTQILESFGAAASARCGATATTSTRRTTCTW